MWATVHEISPGAGPVNCEVDARAYPRFNRRVAGFWDRLEKPFTALAPMEDITDTAFRRLVARYARPDVFFTEFVNVDGMCSPGREAVIYRLRHTDVERPLVAQVWGLKPENFEQAARDIREMGFDGVDLNMGCSVKKVVKTGACARLIENPSLADEMIRATVQGAGGMPVSIKTRIGYADRKTLEWAAFLLDHNPAALTVHGRTAWETYSVPADWNEIAKVVSLRNRIGSNTIIIGNGDVTAPEQTLEFSRRYGVDGVMIGRAAFRDPLIFRKPGSAGISDLGPGEKAGMMREHIILHRDIWADECKADVLKKFARTYISNFKGATALRARLMDANSYGEMLEILSLPLENR